MCRHIHTAVAKQPFWIATPYIKAVNKLHNIKLRAPNNQTFAFLIYMHTCYTSVLQTHPQNF